MTRRIIALAGVLALAAPSPAVACLWDHDTLRQERARFPHALELITGKFLRHSKEAYAWRIRDRTARLAADPDNLALRDDLAVAYQKVGDTAKAIEIMTAADRLRPDRYETLANLGTFYILAGELERGLAYVDRALAINPEAHFGRERHQKWGGHREPRIPAPAQERLIRPPLVVFRWRLSHDRTMRARRVSYMCARR